MIPHLFLTGHPSVGKTTLLKTVATELQTLLPYLLLHGFYTEESKIEGERMGFDIVCPPANANAKNTNTEEWNRFPLARKISHRTLKKNEPSVGKYLVDIDNIQDHAIPSLNVPVEKNMERNKLILLDEVGKMEMKCGEFVSAVHSFLNLTSDSTNPTRNIVLGTIPTPRYGRVIPEIESLRERTDVIVFQVTKQNRDILKDLLLKNLLHIYNNPSSNIDWCKDMKDFLYTRPIGASKNVPSPPKLNSSSNLNQSSMPKPCAPLISKAIPPTVLLLGSTASPLPKNTKLSYHERSMWIIFSELFDIPFKPIPNIDTAPATSP